MANFNVGKDAKTVNVHLKLSLRAGVKNKSLKQSKGTGASGYSTVYFFFGIFLGLTALVFFGDLVAFFAGLLAGFFAAAGFLAFGFAAFFSAAGFFAAVFFGSQT
jgi:hypothetical protein